VPPHSWSMRFDRRRVLILLLGGCLGLVLVSMGIDLPHRHAFSHPAEVAPNVAGLTGVTTTPIGDESGPVVVDVVGAVRHPGVYTLAPGSRARDAVRRAGGPTRRADIGSVNLAVRLADGEQVRVPSRDPGAVAPAGTTAGAPPAVVHLNSANAEQLDALDGIGPSLAQRIVDYRRTHGGFRSIDELDEVSGIGPVRLESLRPQLAL
jgi:competence protein ComEA